MTLPAFPLPPVAFNGESRANPADAALDWLRQGWALFAEDKLRWCFISLFFCALVVAPAALTPYALWLSLLLLPFFAAGWHELCRMAEMAEETNRRPLPGDFFVSFTAPSLFIPGILGAGAFWLAWTGFSFVLSFAAAPEVGADFWLMIILYGFFLPVLMIPLGMTLLFAPPLLHPCHLSPGRAFKASFTACRKNLMPLFLFALLLSLLASATLLSFGLLLPVALPVAFAAWRAACHDIFIVL
ncbi:MAG: hypothetical protein LBI31_03940 [Zoogloeaceae bacterium]|jgi:uncharacterized membrane protein|nr:hypothetical protein [Zoogloeaceae bacterium]